MALTLDETNAMILIEALLRECEERGAALDLLRHTSDEALARWQEVADQRGEKLSTIAKEYEARLLDAGRQIGALDILAHQRQMRIEALEDLGKAYAERLVAAAERLKNLEAELADVYAQKRTLEQTIEHLTAQRKT